MGSAEMQGKLWGAAATQWAELQEPQHKALWDVMLASANVTAGTKLLDAGCGAGSTCELAKQLGADITGLDASQELIAIARNRIPEASFDIGELEALPYPDKTFDVIIASLSVQYAENPIAALKELRRVAKPGGSLVISTWGNPNACDQKHLLAAMEKLLPAPPPGKGPFSLSDEGQLENLIGQAGWTANARGIVGCPFSYNTLNEYWLAQSSAGPMQAALQKVEESSLREVLKKAAKPFKDDQGRIKLTNQFIYVKAMAQES